MATRPVYDKEFLLEVRRANERGRRELAKKRWAKSARYDFATDRVTVELANGAIFGFPARLLPDLARATPAELAEVEVSPAGQGLHWESLDADYSVNGLQEWLFDKRAPMKELGRAGGRSRSAAKKRAARLNGARGGRPRGTGRTRSRRVVRAKA